MLVDYCCFLFLFIIAIVVIIVVTVIVLAIVVIVVIVIVIAIAVIVGIVIVIIVVVIPAVIVVIVVIGVVIVVIVVVIPVVIVVFVIVVVIVVLLLSFLLLLLLYWPKPPANVSMGESLSAAVLAVSPDGTSATSDDECNEESTLATIEKYTASENLRGSADLDHGEELENQDKATEHTDRVEDCANAMEQVCACPGRACFMHESLLLLLLLLVLVPSLLSLSLSGFCKLFVLLPV